MSEHYRVPKREVAAEVTLLGQPSAKVTLFLAELAQNHHGPERPSDIFNGTGTFVPAMDTEAGLVLLQRDAIMSVTVSAESEFGTEGERAEDLAFEAATSIEVDIAMQNGDRFQGSLMYIMPEGRRRLVDFINQADQFFALRVGNTARLINRRRISKIATVKK